MRVVMKFRGGPLDGSQEFTDSGRPLLRIDENLETNVTVGMMIYDLTGKGQVGKAPQKITPALFELLNRAGIPDGMTSAGQQYQIISREEDAIKNTVEIVADYVLRR